MPATTTPSGPPTATWPADPPTYLQTLWYGPPTRYPGYPPVPPWTYPPVGPTAPPPPLRIIPAMSSHSRPHLGWTRIQRDGERDPKDVRWTSHAALHYNKDQTDGRRQGTGEEDGGDPEESDSPSTRRTQPSTIIPTGGGVPSVPPPPPIGATPLPPAGIVPP